MHDSRDKWYDIGIELGVDSGKLEEIKNSSQDNQDRLRDMFVYRLKQDLTDEALQNALKAPRVNVTRRLRGTKDKGKKD